MSPESRQVRRQRERRRKLLRWKAGCQERASSPGGPAKREAARQAIVSGPERVKLGGHVFTRDELLRDYDIAMQALEVEREARNSFERTGDPQHLVDAVRQLRALPARPVSDVLNGPDSRLAEHLLTTLWYDRYGPIAPPWELGRELGS